MVAAVVLWQNSTMRTTIDSGGRIVIPKAVRDQAHLDAGREVTVRFEDGAVVIEPIPLRVSLRRRGRFLVAQPRDSVPPLTSQIVESTREAIATRARRK